MYDNERLFLLKGGEGKAYMHDTRRFPLKNSRPPFRHPLDEIPRVNLHVPLSLRQFPLQRKHFYTTLDFHFSLDHALLLSIPLSTPFFFYIYIYI